ncbi:hypothetical protein C8R42DRAFT_479361 [Lentinula raphanica]|nr:hypothetical protein C8R42DRAFT_479361 [Lentinula raphanica]
MSSIHTRLLESFQYSMDWKRLDMFMKSRLVLGCPWMAPSCMHNLFLSQPTSPKFSCSRKCSRKWSVHTEAWDLHESELCNSSNVSNIRNNDYGARLDVPASNVQTCSFSLKFQRAGSSNTVIHAPPAKGSQGDSRPSTVVLLPHFFDGEFNLISNESERLWKDFKVIIERIGLYILQSSSCGKMGRYLNIRVIQPIDRIVIALVWGREGKGTELERVKTSEAFKTRREPRRRERVGILGFVRNSPVTAV